METESVNTKSNYTRDTNPDILIRKIDELENLLFQKDVEILERDEEISCLKCEIKAFDNLMGYDPNMSYDDKVKYNEECEKELENAETNLDLSTKRTYQSDMEKEDRMIDCALEINELQFEVSELFKSLKINIDETIHEEYKKHKRAFYRLIDFFYNNYKGEEKVEIFDILIDMLDKEKKVYELDEEIKNIK